MHLPHRPVALGLAVACTALAAAPLASASDFCVNAPAGCAGTPVTAAGLSAALGAAQSNGADDRFFLAPGTYSAPAFAYQSPERVQIVGAGAGRTVLAGSLPGGSVLALGGNVDSEVSGVTLRPTGGAASGLTLHDAQADGIVVDGTALGVSAGVMLYGGATFAHGSVDLGGGVDGPAVLGLSGRGTVSDSTLTAPGGYGAAAAGGDVTVRRSTLAAHVGGLSTGGHLSVGDSLIDLRAAKPGTGAMGVYASTSRGGSLTAGADVERVTIAGSAPDAIGVSAEAAGPGRTATVGVRDSVIAGVGVPIDRDAGSGATATVTTDHSAYPALLDPSHDAGAGGIVENARVDAAPRFADAPYGDFHLAAGSPLIDAGTPGDLPAGTLDRDGNPRPVDGNGDCVPATDIGAFEFTAGDACGPAPVASGAAPAPAAAAAAPRPVISRLKVTPARIAHGRTGTVSFRLSEAATVQLRLAHGAVRTRVRRAARQGANRIRLGARVLRRPGAYRLTAVAVDRAGARSRPVSVRFTALRPRRR